MKMRYTVCWLMALVLLTACETVVDPATGVSETRWTLPGTAGNAAAAQDRWNQCVQFRSESFCERNLAGGRPVGTPITGDYPMRNDP